MSEDTAAAAEAAPDSAGLAMDLAMEEARADPSTHGKVNAFLGEHIALVEMQKHHLAQQFGLGMWEKRLSVFLRLATAVVGIAVATGLGATVWDAAHSRGLIIEPFSVPPDLTGRGLSGEVIASQVLDRLTVMTKTESSRAVQSYANNWGNDIKMEIPETGISVGELRRFLRNWLGHDIRISGEVYRTATGIAVTARTAGDAGARFTGTESEMDALVQKAAEHVYEVTQPYRYANYLDRNRTPVGLDDRMARATVIYRKLIAGDDPVERAWAWNGLGTIEAFYTFDNRKSATYYRKAMETVPEFTISYYALAARNSILNQEEAEFQNTREAARLLHRSSNPDLNPHYAPYARLASDARIALYLGDFATAIPIFKAGAELPDDFAVLARGIFVNGAITAMARRHDRAAMLGYLRDQGWTEIPMARSGLRAQVALVRENWRDIRMIEADWNARLAKTTVARQDRPVRGGYNNLRYLFAIARAHLGDFTAAEKLLAPLPPDNDNGLRARAVVADLKGDYARADWWFARSKAQTPSLPLTDLLWGQALLKRGQPDAAMAKFQRANTLGPKFADPLEGWGEALMAQNKSHLALAKFAEADKYAPNWGRLHLKWGEALVNAGKPGEAKAHFARAATLDLTPSEKSELARMQGS